jgi:integrase
MGRGYALGAHLMSKKFVVNLTEAVCEVDTSQPDLTLAQLLHAHELARPDLRLGPSMKKWSRDLGHINAWQLTPEIITRARDAMLQAGYKAGTCNRDVGSLGMIYRWAQVERKIAPAGFIRPTKLVPRLKESIRRVEADAALVHALRYLSRTAFPDKRFGLFVAMLLDSGCRKSEILERTWSELDIDKECVLVPNTKNGDPRALFFSSQTMNYAKQLRPSSEVDLKNLIFSGAVGRPINYRKSWTTLTSMVRRPDLHMHDCRHIVAMEVLQGGASIADAAALLGHRDHTMTTRRYEHLSVSHIRSVQQNRFNAAT